jgi:hypothetical protein
MSEAFPALMVIARSRTRGAVVRVNVGVFSVRVGVIAVEVRCQVLRCKAVIGYEGTGGIGCCARPSAVCVRRVAGANTRVR